MSRTGTPAESARRGPGGRIVILGASARSLAESAVRAGWAVHAADLFGDLDLRAIAHDAVAVTNTAGEDAANYPWSLRAAASVFPSSAPWCYTGAIENYPEFIDALADTRSLAGNSGDVVRRLRNPVEVADAARAAGLTFPETRTSPDGVPLDGTFLVKPLRGAGGRGIRRWTWAEAAHHAPQHATTPREIRIWQRFVTGDALSASYCFAQQSVRLLGVSRQLIGQPWCHAGEFAWCGGLTLDIEGDRPAHDGLTASLERLGLTLAARFRPVGLVGVDLIIDPDRRITVIEVNPRPTASMELLERSGAGSIADSHLKACGFAGASDMAGRQPPSASTSTSTWAKAVLFAAQPTSITQPLIDSLTRATSPWTQADGGWPALADIPRPGQIIPAGAPVTTIFAVALTADAAVTTLRDRVARIDSLLSAIRRHT